MYVHLQRPDSEIARDSLRALAGLGTFHAKAMQDVSIHTYADDDDDDDPWHSNG